MLLGCKPAKKLLIYSASGESLDLLSRRARFVRHSAIKLVANSGQLSAFEFGHASRASVRLLRSEQQTSACAPRALEACGCERVRSPGLVFTPRNFPPNSDTT